MSKQWYRESINWTLSGKGFSEKNIQQVFIHLLGRQQLFNPKEIRYQVIEQQQTQQPKEKAKKNHQKSKKPKKLSKKEQIIQANNLRMQMEREASDMTKIQHHIKKKCIDLPKLQTPLGKLMWMGYLLKYFYQQKDLTGTYDVYLDLKNILAQTEDRYLKTFRSEYKEILSQSKKWIQEDITSPLVFQLTKMNQMMPPLTRFKRAFRLDEWQKQALLTVEKRESLLVCAPTSSGKTIITTYLSLVEGCKIFVVPSESLVWQVASIFSPLLQGKIALLADNIEYIPDHQIELFIGTPQILETYLVNNNLVSSIEYGIFDEIHDLNGREGSSTERLLKMISCPVLALSATIGNREELTHWWKQFRPELKCINYQSRFLNLQRYQWDVDKIKPISPVQMLTVDQVQDKDFIKSSLELTPPDLYRLWQDMNRCFPSEEVQKYHPNNFSVFTSSYRITLPQCNEYEKHLQQALSDLANKYPEAAAEMCSPVVPETLVPSNPTSSLLKLATMLKQKKMFPSLWFQQHSIKCNDLYQQLIIDLENEEERVYPDYQQQLEKKWEEYNENEKKLGEMDSIDRQNGEDYCPGESEQFKLPQPPPLGQPHAKFVLFPPGKIIKNSDLESLIQKLTREMHLKQAEKHFLIRGLRRGIGLYLYHLPLAYLQMVQRLAQDGILGIVFSDISLAYGVNMPFRTVVFCQDHPELNSLVAKQMAGRAGRRGMDTQGNLVYYNLPQSKIRDLNWGKLMRVTGREIYYPLISLQDVLSPDTLEKTLKYPLVKYTQTSKISSSPEEYQQYSCKLLRLMGLPVDRSYEHPFIDILWHLRNSPAEACMLWQFTNVIRKYCGHRRDERDDIKLFLLLSHIVERKPLSTTSTLTLPSLDTIEPGLCTEFQECQSDLPESVQLPYSGQELDGTMYHIFQSNKVPEDFTQDQIAESITRLRNIGEICRIYRNRIIHKKDYLQLEEIFRKTFRRIYYVILAC